MQINLVFPPFYLETMYNLPPLGLINIATSLGHLREEDPYHIRINDFVLAVRQGQLKMSGRIYDDCADIILGDDPDVVGLSAQCTTYPGVVQIAERLKKRRSGLKIFIGGHNASFVDQLTLERFPWIDAVVRGEGEITSKELIKAYAKNQDESGIAGVTFRRGDAIVVNPDRELIDNLDQMAAADYRYVAPLADYRDACGLPRSIAVLEVGRGCPHRCVYCSESILWQRRTRTFSVERLVEEMKHLAHSFGAECFLLAYDQFTANRKFVETFCRQVIDAHLNQFPWYCISRLDTVDRILLQLMREAGCESMCYGIDSGSQRTLQFIHKRIDPSILYQRVRETTNNGIIPTLSYIIGFPEEQKRDIDDTLTLALKTGVQGNSNPLIQMPTVLPGTELHGRYGDQLKRVVDTYFSLGIAFDHGRRLVSDDALIDGDASIFSSFYNVPNSALSIKDIGTLSDYFPMVVNLYPKSFLLIAMALQKSVCDLFFDWLTWIKEKRAYHDYRLEPADCYQLFGAYFKPLLRESGIKDFRHLENVIDYETTAIAVSKYEAVHTAETFSENVSMTDDNFDCWFPAIFKNVALAQYDYDMAEIVNDMQAGKYLSVYPQAAVQLVFRHAQNELEVTAINDFGRDFLDLCNGNNSLKEISDALFADYANGLPVDAFFDNCREAISRLITLNLLYNARK